MSVVLVVIATLVLLAFYHDYAGTRSPGSSQRPSNLAIVFEPAVVVTDRLIDYFRPSHLRQLGCSIALPLAERLPFGVIVSLAGQC